MTDDNAVSDLGRPKMLTRSTTKLILLIAVIVFILAIFIVPTSMKTPGIVVPHTKIVEAVTAACTKREQGEAGPIPVAATYGGMFTYSPDSIELFVNGAHIYTCLAEFNPVTGGWKRLFAGGSPLKPTKDQPVSGVVGVSRVSSAVGGRSAIAWMAGELPASIKNVSVIVYEGGLCHSYSACRGRAPKLYTSTGVDGHYFLSVTYPFYISSYAQKVRFFVSEFAPPKHLVRAGTVRGLVIPESTKGVTAPF